MQTERFNQLRKNLLEKIFNKKDIVKVWRDIVKNQLRSSDIKDLFDHYDFNYNIEDRALAIRNEILNGNYKTSQPLIYRIEKKLGICRHLVIPQPMDALILQVLVEYVSDEILSNQPSKKAFYSRDRHSKFKPHEVASYSLNWRKQWKQLQKMIYNFTDEKNLIAVTDLTNYYDSIDLRELRKVFTSYSRIDEVIIDLLFRLIEEISWRPDYLPYSERGLPTTNIEGVRLLAHSFLFEIDDVLKQKTNDSFTRWMDDIVIGVDNKKHAIETISAISDMLKTRGLSLNISKTNIYDQKDGYYHFQIEANHYLDGLELVEETDTNYASICSELYVKFNEHFIDQGAKYWEKVTKRYITAFKRLKSLGLLKNLDQLYIDYPGIRSNLLFYLSYIGYNDDTAQKVLDIVENIDIFDDISLYQICHLVTDWEIDINQSSKSFLQNFEKIISDFSFRRRTPFDFYCILWFKAKYSHPEELLKFVTKNKNIWQTNSFLRRQVTAIFSRLLIANNKIVEELLYSQISSGIPNTVTLANQILLFSNIEQLDNKLSYYLFNKNVQRPYPLYKFLVLCSILNSEKIRNDDSIKEKIIAHIKDPYYLKWLDAQYNIY